MNITPGAYAKIERGEADAPTSRLLQIAQILDVHISRFFDDTPAFSDNKNSNYGYASKSEVENLSHLVQMLIREVEKLRADTGKKKAAKKSRSK